MSDTKYAIRVTSKASYVADQSDPDAERYVFAYTITIENTGSVTAQLVNRHWIITDAGGRIQEVRGEGVVGEQPVLAPGRAFRYTSAAMIETPTGSMRGSYEMRAADGMRFEADIPEFELRMPRTLH